jgi:addiction module RelE/StbE family toxin
MKVRFHKNITKRYKKLQPAEKKKFDERITLFMENTHNVVLDNHPLRGSFVGYRSINITGDLRAVYKVIDQETAYFVVLGTHNELYS